MKRQPFQDHSVIDLCQNTLPSSPSKVLSLLQLNFWPFNFFIKFTPMKLFTMLLLRSLFALLEWKLSILCVQAVLLFHGQMHSQSSLSNLVGVPLWVTGLLRQSRHTVHGVVEIQQGKLPVELTVYCLFFLWLQQLQSAESDLASQTKLVSALQDSLDAARKEQDSEKEVN